MAEPSFSLFLRPKDLELVIYFQGQDVNLLQAFAHHPLSPLEPTHFIFEQI